MFKQKILKRVTALALGVALLSPMFSSFTVMAEEAKTEYVAGTQTIYIPQENFGQIAEGSLDANELRCGVGKDKGNVTFSESAASYWSGETVGGSSVAAGRALVMRMEIPEGVDPQLLESITLEFTVSKRYNNSARTLSLFALNEELPETVSSLWNTDGTGKELYSCKSLAAVSSEISGGAGAGTKVVFDLTAYAKSNPDLNTYEFEMLSSADMLGFYNANAEVEASRPKVTISYSERATTVPGLRFAGLCETVNAAQTIREKIQNGTEYSSKSLDFFNRMYEQAILMLNDDYEGGFKPYKENTAILQTMIDVIQSNLNKAIEDMVEKDYQPNRYTAVPVGQTWLDTEGSVIQAHGGGFLQMEDVDGTPIYYWVGEDKAHNRAAFNGISLYSSKDLLNWDFEGTLLSADYRDIALLPNKVMERPKLLYNEKTGIFVLWVHWEGNGYSASQVCVATCDTVNGKYELIGHWRPGAVSDEFKNWGVYQDGVHYDEPNEDGTLRMIEDYTDTSLWGNPSRDMTVFSDGDNAYLASLGWIYKLNDTFTDIDTSAETGMTPYKMPDGHDGWEAPALVKMGDYYVLVASGQSGWSPNQCRYYYTKDIENPNGWQTNTEQSNGMFYIGNNTTFHSQSTNIMHITGTEGSSYIYMGDHWNSSALGDSTYVWLPITVEGLDTDSPRLTMLNYSGWVLDVEKGSAVVPETEKELISKGKPVTCDVEANESYPLEFAFDGDYHTHFIPNPAKAPFTYTIDLEEVYNLTRFDLSTRMVNGSETYYQFTVETSVDGEEWTEQINAENNTDQGFKSAVLTGKGRYVRLNILREYKKNGQQNQFLGISEVEVFGYMDESEVLNSVYMDDVQNVTNGGGTEIRIPIYVNGIGSGQYRSVSGIIQIPEGFDYVGIEDMENLNGGNLNSTNTIGVDGKLYIAYLKTDASENDVTTISQNSEQDPVFTLTLKLKEEQEAGSKHEVRFKSFEAVKSIDGDQDGAPNEYETIAFDVTNAISTVTVSEGQAQEITAFANELYVGDGQDLIPENKKAVSITFTNVEQDANILYGDVQLYYSAERSEKNGGIVYVGIVETTVDIADMNTDSTESTNAVYTITASGKENICFGDTNDDENVNASDALNVLNAWLRNSSVSKDKQILVMNVTADGRIDTSDVLAVVDNFVNQRGFSVVNK